jgi:putative lipoprotein
MRLRIWLTVVGAAIVVQGCAKASPEAASPASSVVNIDWRLVAVAGAPAGNGASGQPATLRLDDVAQRASGYAGCNQFSGGYTLSGNSLAFGPLAMTRMACAAGDDLERSYTTALEQTTEFKVTSKGLELRKGSVLLAKFTR